MAWKSWRSEMDTSMSVNGPNCKRPSNPLMLSIEKDVCICIACTNSVNCSCKTVVCSAKVQWRHRRAFTAQGSWFSAAWRISSIRNGCCQPSLHMTETCKGTHPLSPFFWAISSKDFTFWESQPQLENAISHSTKLHFKELLGKKQNTQNNLLLTIVLFTKQTTHPFGQSGTSSQSSSTLNAVCLFFVSSPGPAVTAPIPGFSLGGLWGLATDRRVFASAVLWINPEKSFGNLQIHKI